VILLAVSSYPVRVEATLDTQLSRWLWLVKLFLAIPHYVVLAFLWMAFVVVSVTAFFAIVFTGRYPRGLFDFNVGVLRWSWRVHYYTFAALATDRYPPFTLGDVADYPAHLDVSYPERLSRGLVWVKWRLLAIPHYIIAAIFIGGGTWAAWNQHIGNFRWAPGGLLGILVLIAAVVLLMTGRYPQQIFDFVLGIDRWVLRVAAYAALMTDDYPPFRLDMGGHEPGGTITVPPPGTPPGPAQPPPTAPPASGERRGWTGSRITALVAGCVLGLISVGLLAAGGVATWADNTQRDSTGYLTSGTHSFATSSYALTSGRVDLGSSGDVFAPADILGTVRLRVTPVDPRSSVFVGVAPATPVNRYLAGVSREEVSNWAQGTLTYRSPGGGAPAAAPTSMGFWTVHSSGTGLQTLTWKPGHGSWTAVVMNTSATSGLSVTADVGATVPDLGWMALGVLVGGALCLIGAAVLIVIPVVRASR
jgi:Domain of unknown function (DUF4389)